MTVTNNTYSNFLKNSNCDHKLNLKIQVNSKSKHNLKTVYRAIFTTTTSVSFIAQYFFIFLPVNILKTRQISRMTSEEANKLYVFVSKDILLASSRPRPHLLSNSYMYVLVVIQGKSNSDCDWQLLLNIHNMRVVWKVRSMTH